MSKTSEFVRMVAVINKRIDPGVAMNALFHLASGLTNLIGEEGRERLQFLDFEDANGGLHRSISARSFIVLRGTSNEIRKLREASTEAGVPSIDFTSTMTGDTFKEQLERTQLTPFDDLEFYGIALFGDKDTLSPMTRKLSLWK